jgi:predicted permease
VNRIRAIGEYFDALSRGDPIALGLTAVLALIAAGLGLLVWFVTWRAKVDDRRWKERLRKKRGY